MPLPLFIISLRLRDTFSSIQTTRNVSRMYYATTTQTVLQYIMARRATEADFERETIGLLSKTM